ncbi:MAG TPA: hypothetical protein VNA13_03245 [Xanthomonadales bacterium]|nr:hypothetical protein [Xanthomonadales bacterium]
MSIITAQITNKYYDKNSFFDLLVDIKDKSTNITITFFTQEVTTGNIPLTHSLLKEKLPSVLRSKCFNDGNLPFRTEVKNTEFGHLFEHILLEYVCELKRKMGIKHPVHNGVTNWNWYKDKRGMFHIKLDVGIEDEDLLRVALYSTSKLFEQILLSTTDIASPTQFTPIAKAIPLHLQLK